MDMIYAISVIYYLPDPQKAIEEFCRVLKPGGILMITAHTKYSIFTFDRIIKRFLKLKIGEHLNGILFYSSLQYKHMFDKAGLKLITVDGFKISYIIWPVLKRIYQLMGLPTEKLLKLSRDNDSISRIRNWIYLRWIKSIICYHPVLVGRTMKIPTHMR
jgi:SAM-dependent methyltransferase